VQANGLVVQPQDAVTLQPQAVTLQPQGETLQARLLRLRNMSEVQKVLENVKKRNSPSEFSAILIGLCAIEPLQPPEIAELMGKGESRVRQMLTKLVGPKGPLYYTIPDMIHHPRQAYTTVRPVTKSKEVLG